MAKNMRLAAHIVLILTAFDSATQAYTEQEINDCRELAMDVPPDYKLGGGNVLKWQIDKISPLIHLPDGASIPTVNVCGTFSFLEEQKCDSMYYELTMTEAGKTVVFRAESLEYNNIVEMQKTIRLVDNSDFIFQGEVIKMLIYAGAGSEPETIEVPDFLKQAESQLFSLVSADPAGKWRLYATCSKSISWSIISPEALQSEDKTTVYAEIDAALRSTGLQYSSSMRAIDEKFIFDV